jgi:hypothetical protein
MYSPGEYRCRRDTTSISGSLIKFAVIALEARGWSGCRLVARRMMYPDAGSHRT